MLFFCMIANKITKLTKIFFFLHRYYYYFCLIFFRNRFYKKYRELRDRIKASSYPVLSADTPIGVGVNDGNNLSNNYQVQRSASLKDHRHLRYTYNIYNKKKTIKSTI